MPVKAIQQFQLRPMIGTEKQAQATLRALKESGYEGIELCGFLIRKMPLFVHALTALAGMPIGSSGNLNWKRLVADSGLAVVAIHEDLGGILKRTREIAVEARAYGTQTVVVTGMQRFDYSNRQAVLELAIQLNRAGQRLAGEGIRFLYHNHNCEFRHVEAGLPAYRLLVEATDPQWVNFEFDSYWATEAGCDVPALMHLLGERMKLYHINDRGTRATGPTGSILKSDSMELGYGNMNLVELVRIAKRYGVEAVILESHRNWAEGSPVKSFQLSAAFMNAHV